MTFIKIAWRNIIRSKKRSLITISAVGFGLGALIFIWSFVEGSHFQMIDNYTSLLTGHVQVHASGFHKRQKLETNINDYPKLLNDLRQMPEVISAAPRIRAVGLISSAESSAGAAIYGVSVRDELTVGKLNERIKPGRFPEPGNNKEIVIGKTIAENLNLEVGNKAVIMSQATDGSIASGAFVITGLIDTGAEEIDNGLVMITHAAAEELFVMQGRTSEIALKVRQADKAQRAAEQIREGLNRPDLEVLSWQAVSPMLEQWIEFDNAFIWIIVIIVMIIVAIGILNTVLMGVMERTREFGILLALGTKQEQILIMVAWESVFLGLIGSIAGLLLGTSLSVYFAGQGIDLSVFTSALNSFYMEPIIYPRLDPAQVIVSVTLVLLTSVIVSLYPAWHAANLKPMDAIRSM